MLLTDARGPVGKGRMGDTIPPEMIKKSFQKCCISNALDGTEDEFIFDSDNELDDDEEQCSEDSEMDIYILR